jgi:hypothetical protein
MTDFDFERLKDYSLLEKRFEFAPRKRVPYYDRLSDTPSEDSSSAEIPMPLNSEMNGTDFPDMMKEYDTDTEGIEVNFQFQVLLCS